MRRPQGEYGVSAASMPAAASAAWAASRLAFRVLTRRGLVQARHQSPEALVAELQLQRLRNPVGQVVAQLGRQCVAVDGQRLRQPFLLVQFERRLQERRVTGPAEDREPSLDRPAARLGEVLVEQAPAQHCIGRLRQRVALARPELTVLAQKEGDDVVGGRIELQHRADQFGAGSEQGFGVHA
jgi:hypothetical protein